MTKIVNTPCGDDGRFRTLTLDAAHARVNHEILVGDIRRLQSRLDECNRILAMNDALLPGAP